MFNKHKGVVQFLHKRELGVKSFYRYNLQILKLVVSQKRKPCRKIWQCNSTKLFFYECRKLYMDNYRTCFTVLGFNHEPQKLYKLDTLPKLEDGLCCASPGDSPSYDHKTSSCFLAVASNNWLYQIHFENGAILDKFYLSRHYKFRKISYESYGYTVVLKSVLNVTPQSNQDNNRGNVLCALLFLSLFPIQFIGMVEILRSVFGKDITNVTVMDEILMLCHQPGKVRLYSLQNILQNCTDFDVKLTHFGELKGEIVGKFPFGFPINIKIKAQPPVLYEVNCCNNELEIGGFPWQCIIRPHRNFPNKFEVFTLDPPHTIINGSLEYETTHIEPDHVIFHPDNSGRIIHYSSTTLRCLFVNTNYETLPILKSVFTLSLDVRPKMANTRTYTKSGRLVRHTERYSNSTTEDQHSIIGMHYENELDIILLLIANPSNNSCYHLNGFVNLYDNQTGESIRKIELKETWDEDAEHRIILDCDVLIHIVKSIRFCSTCYVYSLV